MDWNMESMFERYLEEGWHPHKDSRSYTCGHCGTLVNSWIGLWTQWHTYQSSIGDSDHVRDIRICTSCRMATTFVDNRGQIPGPLSGEQFDPRKADEEVKDIILLYNQARYALRDNATSCAVLAFRKILMHICTLRFSKVPRGTSGLLNT